MRCSADTDVNSLSMPVSVVGLRMTQLTNHRHVTEKGDKVNRLEDLITFVPVMF